MYHAQHSPDNALPSTRPCGSRTMRRGAEDDSCRRRSNYFMRLWSFHPSYLDSKGLVALWREGLLAQSVLAGQTSGYRNHPQLHRFLKTDDPLAYIGSYLMGVAKEARRRGYRFNEAKIAKTLEPRKLTQVTRDQLRFEFQHLLKKLKIRDVGQFKRLKSQNRIRPHPSFRVIPGKIQSWERINYPHLLPRITSRLACFVLTKQPA